MDVRVGLWRKLTAEELMLLNCGAGKDSESPLDCKEIQPVHPKGNQSWIFIRRTNAEASAEASILWHLMGRADSLEKTLMLGNIEGRRRRGQQRLRWLDGITNSIGMSLSKLGVGDGQGGLVCCSPWGHKKSDTTEPLNWTDQFPDLTSI